MISVLILTRNEQQDLPAALASVAWSDDIHVLDSCSTDATPQIVLAAGAALHTRPFDNWASHQNWALSHIPFRHEWVFYLDADEIVTPHLRQSLFAAVQQPGEHVAFRIRRRDFYGDTWLRHAQATPYYLRLFRPEKMRYERLVNPISIADGPVGHLQGCLDHFPFSKGMGRWLERHNSYSALEAAQIVANDSARQPVSLRAAIFDKDFTRRRYHQKELFYSLPCRPLLKFFALYILKRGFLDGRAGLTYATLQSIYEYFIILKTGELRRNAPKPIAEILPPQATCDTVVATELIQH